MIKNPVSIIFIVTTFISGLSTALVFPLTSLYLVDAIGCSPLEMGVFLVVMVLSSVIASMYLGKKSDTHWSRSAILSAAQISFFIGVVILAFTRDYYIALVAAIVFLSVGGAALPQIFTLGRLYADKELNNNSAQFLSVMRAGIALAWVVGPPIAFLLKEQLGFTATFVCSGLLALSMLLLISYLPDHSKFVADQPSSNDEPVQNAQHWLLIPGVALFLLSTLAMFSANNMYITALPIYLTKELTYSAQWAGYLMGMAAFIEIPFMVLAGSLANRIGTMRLLVIGVAAGILYYSGLLVLTNIWQLLALQLFNGIFIAITASLGMIVMQDLMRNQMGLGTTLFSSAQQLSMLVGSLCVGLIAQYFDYHTVFLGSLVASILALIVLLGVMLRTSQQKKQLTDLQASP
ncbi:sugar efflux transporter [Motilimonas cestriensis]|uniref:Sugar efflux transporter n=1 Tax=Motilimonas cestriensis TaxID=2742685 RepID=A0ABS8WCI5_9GAMM|nr:sugar efflux transporter [Motilimonas cestriensis]MCE2595331.1 sugar efflux transporter [Motilimonas cestriensis]